MAILGWMLLGAAFGIVGKLLLRGDDPNSAFVPPILGVIGGVIGGVAGEGAGAALAGAVTLVVLYAITTGRPPAVPHRR